MKKSWNKVDIILFLMIAVIFGLSFYLWSKLPEIVPTHWNVQGVADGWGPKWLNLFLMPGIMLGMFLLFIYLPRLDPLKKNYEQFKQQYQALKAMIIIFFAFLYGIIVYSSFPDARFEPGRIFPIGFGLFFIFLGYFLPTIRRNWFIGIKTPWTISSQESWEKTHKLGGRLFMAAGLIAILSGIISAELGFIFFIGAIVLAAIIPSIYSYFVWKNDKTRK